MTQNNLVSSEEQIMGKTLGDFAESDKTSSETYATHKKTGVGNIVTHESSQNLTPTDFSLIKRHESEAIKNGKQADFYQTLAKCAKNLSIAFGLIIAVLGVYWAYYLSSVAEPIGGLKESVKYYQIQNQKLEDRVKVLEDRLVQTREEYLKKR
jgi:hypothetical protein